MTPHILAIDPGKNGGIAIAVDGEIIVHKMPCSITQAVALLEAHRAAEFAVIEWVGAWGADGKSRGMQYGIQKMVINANMISNTIDLLGIPRHTLHPKRWQAAYPGLRNEAKSLRKKRYAKLAQAIYPQIEVRLWNADALLMLNYAMERITYFKNQKAHGNNNKINQRRLRTPVRKLSPGRKGRNH